MPVIGIFTPTKDGGWIGSIRTLTMDVKLRLVPNDDRHSINAPSFQVFVRQSRIGYAWEARSNSDNSKTYLSVKLDDPTLAEPITAAPFPAEDGQSAPLVWSRTKTKQQAA